MKYLALDVLTLGDTPGSGIAQIGWATFDPSDPQHSPSHNGVSISIEANLAADLSIDKGRVKWFLAEGRRLTHVAKDPIHYPHSTLPQILSDVATVLDHFHLQEKISYLFIPHQVQLDVLKEAYHACAIDLPRLISKGQTLIVADFKKIVSMCCWQAGVQFNKAMTVISKEEDPTANIARGVALNVANDISWMMRRLGEISKESSKLFELQRKMEEDVRKHAERLQARRDARAAKAAKRSARSRR